MIERTAAADAPAQMCEWHLLFTRPMPFSSFHPLRTPSGLQRFQGPGEYRRRGSLQSQICLKLPGFTYCVSILGLRAHLQYHVFFLAHMAVTSVYLTFSSSHDRVSYPSLVTTTFFLPFYSMSFTITFTLRYLTVRHNWQTRQPRHICAPSGSRTCLITYPSLWCYLTKYLTSQRTN